MIGIERSYWTAHARNPRWTTKTIWLNVDHVVMLEVILAEDKTEAFRGTDIEKLTVVHTTKSKYYTAEPADELAKRITFFHESKFTYRTVDV